MTIILLLGLACGAGVLVVGRALRPRPVPLAVALRRLDTPATVSTSARRRGWTRSLESGFADRTVRDLRVLHRAAARHAADKLSLTVAFAGFPLAAGLLLAAAGSALPPAVVIVAVPAGGLAGFFVPDLLLHAQAERRRRQFTFALSSYLDLVNVLLAGGAGVETALHATADAGDGWAFGELRHALVRASTSRRSPWVALSDLGAELGVEELVDLASSVQLAGEEGARIRGSLSAKAAALRGRQLARIEADAHAASERMGFPTVAMFLGFLALLAYPAVQQIVGS